MTENIGNFEILNDSLISIEWDKDNIGYLLLRDIRNACPCATCKAAEKGFKKKIQLKNKECYELISIDRVGTYALKFKWADGHETGIYSFESLKKLSNLKE